MQNDPLKMGRICTKNRRLSRIRVVGYFPPAKALSFGLGNATERCHLSPLRLPSPVPRSLLTSGKPAVDIFRLLVVITIFWTKFQKALIFYKFLDII